MLGAQKGTAEIADVNRDAVRTEALLKTGALQSAIFNSANFSSITTDAKGVIQIFNVGAERMLGDTPAEVVNKITPADISDPQELIARAKELSVELGTSITPGFDALVFKASRGIEDIYELTYIRKDRSRFPAVVSVTALRDARDAIIGYLLIGTDNTARKQAEDALLKAGALQSAIFNSANFSSIATDAKGVIQIFNVGAERMLGYVATDVMNKITPAHISDPQEVIARATALSLEFATPIAPGFEALVFKASRGIEDIYELTYIRKDGSRFPAVVSVTALRDAQDAIIGYLLIGTDNTARKQVEEERTKLDQRLRDQHFYTRSLVESNIDALMTTDPRGIITDVNKQTEALTGCTRDELAENEFGEFLKISVTDTGMGISPGGLEQLFKPFSQIDSGLARKFEGTGLGLAMVKLLAELHGGSVAVESAVGEGSCYTVWLPLRAPDGEALPTMRASSPPARVDTVAGMRTALVVEDDGHSAELIRAQLEAQGFKVLQAASAEAALALAVQQALSRITLDITLPNMDGWELLSRLKETPELRRIPIVIISIVADRNRGFALGAAAVMQKPISRQELYESLVGLGLFPSQVRPIKVLVVDDDPKAVELIAVRILGLASTVLRAYGGREAIDIARQELPDLIVFDLMMPDVSGFDVVEALNERADTTCIPILVVTAKQISTEEPAKLSGCVATIMERGVFDLDRFTSEVRRAMSGRQLVA